MNHRTAVSGPAHPRTPQTARVHPECPPEMDPGEGQAQPSSIWGQNPRALTPSVDSQDLGSAQPPRTSRGLSRGMSSRGVSQYSLEVSPG